MFKPVTGSSKQLCHRSTYILLTTAEKLFAIWCKLNLMINHILILRILLKNFRMPGNAINASLASRSGDIHTVVESPRQIGRFEMHRGYFVEKMA